MQKVQPIVPSSSSGATESSADVAVASQMTDVAIERAWRSLGIVNEWVRFLDGKATAIQAADAAIVGALLSFLKGEMPSLNKLVYIPLVVMVVFLSLSIYKGLYCIAPTLYPGKAPWDTMFCFWLKPFVTAAPENKTSVLYFEHIASTTNVEAFADRSHAVLSSEGSMYEQIAQQIHANSVVATHKSEDVGRAIQFLVWALLCGAVAALLFLLLPK